MTLDLRSDQLADLAELVIWHRVLQEDGPERSPIHAPGRSRVTPELRFGRLRGPEAEPIFQEPIRRPIRSMGRGGSGDPERAGYLVGAVSACGGVPVYTDRFLLGISNA